MYDQNRITIQNSVAITIKNRWGNSLGKQKLILFKEWILSYHISASDVNTEWQVNKQTVTAVTEIKSHLPII